MAWELSIGCCIKENKKSSSSCEVGRTFASLPLALSRLYPSPSLRAWNKVNGRNTPHGQFLKATAHPSTAWCIKCTEIHSPSWNQGTGKGAGAWESSKLLLRKSIFDWVSAYRSWGWVGCVGSPHSFPVSPPAESSAEFQLHPSQHEPQTAGGHSPRNLRALLVNCCEGRIRVARVVH